MREDCRDPRAGRMNAVYYVICKIKNNYKIITKSKMGCLISQASHSIIRSESESDAESDSPSVNFLVEIAFTFGVGDAISFCSYGYLCKIVPQISRVKA